MPIPAIIPAAGALAAKFGIGTKLASAFTAAKSLLGIGGAAKATAGVGSAMKMGAVAPGVVAGNGSRMAAHKLGELAVTSPAFKSGIGKALFGTMDKGQVIGRLTPDAFFAGVAALQTPGDIGDKLIAGTTSAVGGGLGGLALGRAAARFGNSASFMADMAGSIGGDMVGMSVGDGLQRGKDSLMGGTGQTAYERMSAEQQAQFAEQIRRQTLAGAGLMPGVQERYFDNTGML
jgi:hypothetical protein